MDFFRPGLSKSVLHSVRSSNTISFRLVEQVRQLNEKTSSFLAELGPNFPTATSDPVEDVFTDFYLEFHINDPSSVAKALEVKIGALRKYQERIEKCPPVTEVGRRMVAIINEYTVLVAVHNLANSILYQTICAKLQLNYWSNVRLSTYSKVIYGIQTLPERVFRFLYGGIRNALVMTQESSVGINQSMGVVRSLVASFKKLFHKATQDLNIDFIVRKSRFSFVKIPLRVIDDEVKHKISVLRHRLHGKYRVLGVILNCLPVSSATLDDVLPELMPGCDPHIHAQLVAVEKLVAQERNYEGTTPPSFVTRYWPFLLLTLNYGPGLTSSACKNREAIVFWFKHNFVDTIVGFWKNWIVKPIGDMLSILRNDETMTIASKESLQSDLDSLERMVVDFLNDTDSNVDPTKVHSAVKKGDLTMVMSQYENELKSPYWSILTGKLVRSILIQVQKTKVDGDLAVSGIDKLLKSQQLLFGVLSTSPSLFIVYQINRALRSDSSLSSGAKDRRIECLKSMNHIEMLVNREAGEDKLVSDGKLFVEVVNLNLLSHGIFPKKLMDEFLRDLNHLALSSSESRSDATSTVNRIWNMYSPFFRD